jgi:hypothetical protein
MGRTPTVFAKIAISVVVLLAAVELAERATLLGALMVVPSLTSMLCFLPLRANFAGGVVPMAGAALAMRILVR